jgi:hypothetical protein
MVREIVRAWCMKDSKVGPQQANQRTEIAQLFEMCRGYDMMAVKSVLVKVRRVHCKVLSDPGLFLVTRA